MGHHDPIIPFAKRPAMTAVALLLLLSLPARATELDDALTSLTGDRIAAHVEVLASDEFEGRAPSTHGEEKTIAYIRDHFQKFGVSPPRGGEWFQSVPLVAKTVDGEPTLRITPADGADSIDWQLGEDYIAGATNVDEKIEFDAVEVVFVGHGIVAAEYGWDDYGGVDVDGKVVLAVQSDPGRAPENEESFKGRALTLYGTTSWKQEEAARRGAAGFILIHDQDIIGYPWSALAKSAHNTRHDAEPNESTQAKPPLWSVASKESAETLFSGIGWSYEEALAAALKSGFRARPLGAKVSVAYRQEIERSVTRNVIGVLPGRDHTEETVVYTAHWDHVGIGEPENGDNIYNGAIDNATGTAVLLELARAFVELPTAPRRTIVFIATAAEEQGLLGAFHYADHPIYPLEKTAAVINMDALFPFGDFNGFTVVALGSSEVEDFLRVAAAAEGRELIADPAPEQGAFFRSDHYPFAKKGVPALFAIGGPLEDPAPSEEIMARFQDYMMYGYHHAADEYDAATWDMRGIAGDARIYFRTGLAIANDDRMPNWYLDSEFRPLRDRLLSKTTGDAR